jgi:hypothetical protein
VSLHSTATTVLALLVVSLAALAWNQSSELAAGRKQLSRATADVRHFKSRAYWLEGRYEEAVQGMRDEHSVDMWRLVEQLRECEAKK